MGSSPFLICKSCLVPLLPGPPALEPFRSTQATSPTLFHLLRAPSKGEPPLTPVLLTEEKCKERPSHPVRLQSKKRAACGLVVHSPFLAACPPLSRVHLKKKTQKCPGPSAAKLSRETPPFTESSFPSDRYVGWARRARW